MSRNRVNSLYILAILIIIVAVYLCIYRSGRGAENPFASPPLVRTVEMQMRNEKELPDNKKVDKGDFIVEHLLVKNSSYEEINRQIKDEKLFEEAADKLNRSLILPNNIYLRAKDCGEINAFYNANEQSITVCNELIEHFYKVFRADGLNDEKAYNKMFDAVRFALLHEVGHALIEIYDLPITGNEEDAADSCSAFINLTELGEDGANAVAAAAEAFSIESKNHSSNKRNLADEHLPHEQRFYNSICLLYGSNTEGYNSMPEENYLPRERSRGCPQEYQQTVNSWSNLLASWRKN